MQTHSSLTTPPGTTSPHHTHSAPYYVGLDKTRSEHKKCIIPPLRTLGGSAYTLVAEFPAPLPLPHPIR